jgi:hypothetical protein
MDKTVNGARDTGAGGTDGLPAAQVSTVGDMILFGDTLHGRIIARGAGIGYDPDVDFCISRVTEAGELLGGVTYTNYTHRTVQMHMAGFVPAWPTPQFMWAIYDFPFNYLSVERVIGTVPSTNERALKIDYKMGFKHLVTVPGIVEGGDMIYLAMAKDECKYLNLGWRYEAMENAA